MSILIIAYEPATLEQLTRVLLKEHYTVDTATDGLQGLDKIWENTYDLILLDIILPHIDGLEVLKKVRATGLETPILMLTAKGDIDDIVTTLNLGADDYLAKPYSLAELLIRVRVLLRRGATANAIIPQQVFLSKFSSLVEMLRTEKSIRHCRE